MARQKKPSEETRSGLQPWERRYCARAGGTATARQDCDREERNGGAKKDVGGGCQGGAAEAARFEKGAEWGKHVSIEWKTVWGERRGGHF